MSTLFKLFVLACIIVAAYFYYDFKSTQPIAELKTVEYVNINRYTGRWYEIARYPNRFQKKCISNVTADYYIALNGNIKVENSCLAKNGKRITSVGTAEITDRTTNAKLRVSFFGPFGSDYYIIALDRNYKYAVVGEPKRKYLWILSRTKTITSFHYEQALRKIKAAGYDISKLKKTIQK